MKHKLVILGWRGVRTAYLDISKEEAKRRYRAANPIDECPEIDTFEFEDQFGVYDAWENIS